MIISMLDYLERAAGLYGERTAYEDSDEPLTFAQLKDRADRMGSALAHMGANKGAVAVYMKKSAAMASAFLGIAAGGCCYCPLDTQMPAARLALVLRTLNPWAVCTRRELAMELKEKGYEGRVLLYEELIQADPEPALLARNRRRRIDTDPMYILFTSGSTGAPKGVVLPARAVIDYVQWVTERFAFGTEDVVGNQGELFFDLSVQDVYAPLISGCKTVFLSHDLFASPAELIGTLRDKGVSIIEWTPSACSVVANLDGMQKIVPDRLRLVMFCGEVMPCRTLNYWMRHLEGSMFVNLYGPTETAVASTYYVVDRSFEDGESLPIGKPCENTDVLVLDEDNRPAREGSVGELCIRGSSLAFGYLKDPKKAEGAFGVNPCNSDYEERIYRTGDLVYFGEDGNLMYVSRKDFQIKHLGFRIELGEIETIAGLLEGIKELACAYDEDKKRIHLFYTGKQWDNRQMKERLSEKLPHYMIPNRIHHLKAMPYTRNGKMDRATLKDWAINGLERV